MREPATLEIAQKVGAIGKRLDLLLVDRVEDLPAAVAKRRVGRDVGEKAGVGDDLLAVVVGQMGARVLPVDDDDGRVLNEHDHVRIDSALLAPL